MKVELGHIITVIVVIVGYLTATLIAWGRMITEVKHIKEEQEQTVRKSDLVAAIAEMKVELYRALGKWRADDNKD